MNVNKININQTEPTYNIASDAYNVTYKNSNVGDKLSELEGKVNGCNIDIIPDKEGYYINKANAGTTADLTPIPNVTHTMYCAYAIVDVKEGDVFHLRSINVWNSAYSKRWMMLTEGNMVHSVSDNSLTLVDEVLTIPSNVVKLVLNVVYGKSESYEVSWKKDGGGGLVGQVGELEQQMTDANSKIAENASNIERLDKEINREAKNIISDFISIGLSNVGTLEIDENGDFKTAQSSTHKTFYCKVKGNTVVRFNIGNLGASARNTTLVVAMCNNIPTDGSKSIDGTDIITVGIEINETKAIEYYCEVDGYVCIYGYGLGSSVFINSIKAEKAVWVLGNPVRKEIEALQILNQSTIGSTGVIGKAYNQAYYVHIYDVSSYADKDVLISGSYNSSGINNYLYSSCSDIKFEADKITAVSVSHSSNSSDNKNNCEVLRIGEDTKFIAVSYNPNGNAPKVEVISADTDTNKYIDERIYAGITLSEKVINKDGLIVNASGQSISVVIIDLSKYDGVVRADNAYLSDNNTSILYSVCKNTSFASINDITDKSRIIKYEPLGHYYSFGINGGEGYLAVMQKNDDIHELSFSHKVVIEDVVSKNREDINVVKESIEDLPQMRSQIAVLQEKVDAGSDYDIIYWGDSLTVGNQDGKGMNIPIAVHEYLGKGTYLNCGIGGEQMTAITFRQGGNTLMIPAGTINGEYGYDELVDVYDAPVGHTLYNQNDQGNSINPITLDNGYTCNIVNDKSKGKYIISGYEGEPTNVPLMMRSHGSGYKSKIAVLWVGQNGINMSPNEDAPFIDGDATNKMMDALECYYESMIRHLGHEHFLVIGHISQAVTSYRGNKMWKDTFDQRLKKYGNRFIHARKILAEYGLAYNGLTASDNCLKVYKRASSSVRTLGNVSKMTDLGGNTSYHTLRVEVTNNKGKAVSADGDYIDIALVSTGSYTLTETTLTYTSINEVVNESEVEQLANGLIPCRLIHDDIHLTHYGYKALGTFIAKRMIALGYDKLI